MWVTASHVLETEAKGGSELSTCVALSLLPDNEDKVNAASLSCCHVFLTLINCSPSNYKPNYTLPSLSCSKAGVLVTVLLQ